MQNRRLRIALFLNFFLFAILLNTVGIVIAQTISDYDVSRVRAASLEAFKDLSIMFASLVLASYVPRFGYRRSMLAALLAVTLASMLIAAVTGFWVAPVLYMVAGASFALMKVSVYSTLGLIAGDQKQHTSLMNLLEGIFQVGSLTGPLLFAGMIAFAHWSDTYWLIALASASALLLMLGTPLDESEVHAGEDHPGMLQMLLLLKLPMVWLFVAAAWLYVMIEQSFNTWLPTFSRETFALSEARAAALLAVYPASIAASRFLAGYLMRRVQWLTLALIYLACAFALTLAVLVLTLEWRPGQAALFGLPPLAFALPLVGFFLGPIYPTISSIVLSRLERYRQSAMTGLIVIFSALGGTSGSLVIGFFSQHYSTHQAFFFPLLPIAVLAMVLVPYRAVSDRFGRAHGTA